MGTSIGGVMIRRSFFSIEPDEIVKQLFQPKYERLDETYLSEERFDTRKAHHVRISVTPQYLIVVNSDFATKFYKESNSNFFDSVFSFFKKPVIMVAFEYYDSGGTYSYSIILNSKLTRYYRSLSYETPNTYGKPLNVELQYLAQLKNDGIDENEVPLYMLRQVFEHEIGFPVDTLDKQITQAFYYKLLM